MAFTEIAVDPPQTEHALMVRARALAGHTLGELALIASVEMPVSQRRAKGWLVLVFGGRGCWDFCVFKTALFEC